MSDKLQIFSVGLLLASIFIALIVYEEGNQRFEDDFSYNLKKWQQKGSYLTYKNIHKLFCIYENLNRVPISSEKRPPALLFLHGFPSSSFDYHKIWNQFLDKNNLIESNELITFDYLGYGLSEKPSNYEYSIFDMADMVDRVLLHFNIQSVIIIAHDISDTVLQEIIRRDNMGNQNNFQLLKCIMLNGGIISSAYQPTLSQLIMRTNYLNELVSSSYLFRYWFFKNSFAGIFGELNKPNATELYDFYLSIRYNHGNRVLPLTINYMEEREQYGNIWYDALNETSLPVLFIYGPADPINLREKFLQKLRQDLPKIKLNVLSDMTGHYPHFEDCFTVFQLISKFLKI